MAGSVEHNFIVSAEEYWNFEKWTANVAAAQPDAQLKQVTFTFNQTDTVIAHLQEEPYAVYVPNSFTPNGDGINDVFIPVGNAMDPANYHLLIFNRWGEVVFESTDLSQEWEGDVKLGEYYVPDMIYTYLLKAKSVHNTEPKEYKGSIHVFR
jgi:gliding motility-associated-like protein